MLQVTDECPHTKEETTTQILASTFVEHFFAIPIPLWFLAHPTDFERTDEHLVKRTQCGPHISKDETENMPTIFAQLLPMPVTGVPSPWIFKGMQWSSKPSLCLTGCSAKCWLPLTDDVLPHQLVMLIDGSKELMWQ